MKTTRIPTNIAKNASKLHKHIGLLLTELYPYFEVRQEYCVSKVNPQFSSNREKFDWAVLGMNIVCEIHGEQHFRPVCFGGITIEEAENIFKKRQEVDQLKKQYAIEAGWAYVEIKYTEKDITKEDLFNKIKISLDQVKNIPKINCPKPKVKIQSKGFDKTKRVYNWPKKKLNSKPFRGTNAKLPQ